MLDLGIGAAEINDPQLVSAFHDLEAGKIVRLTPEQSAALGAIAATSAGPSENGASLAHDP